MLASRNALTAAVSALMAAEDAGLSELDPGTAVFYGVSTMNTDDVLDAYNVAVQGRRLHPSSNPKSMTNAVAAWIPILFGTHGRTLVISTACASGTDAIGAAYEHIAMGKARWRSAVQPTA